MIIHKSYKFRIYPDRSQIDLLNQSMGNVRLVYNLCLEQRRVFSRRGRFISRMDQQAELVDLKKEFPFLKMTYSQCLQKAVYDLNRSFEDFFKRKKGYPKFRRKYINDSICYPQMNNIKLFGNYIILPKLGQIKLVRHRKIKGTPKNLTVLRDGVHWYVSICCKQQIETPKILSFPSVGWDFGVEQPWTNSQGMIYNLPKVSIGESKRLARLQRALSRKIKGSNNREKAREKLRKFYMKLRFRREDYAQKLTTYMAKNHGLNVFEDLSLKNMTKSSKGTLENPGKMVKQKSGLNRSILDLSPGRIKVLLSYKSEWYGSELAFVPAAYTSQRCSHCLHKDKNNRKTRSEFKCVSCGYEDNADINAAKNILNSYYSGSTAPETRLEESCLTVEDKALAILLKPSIEAVNSKVSPKV